MEKCVGCFLVYLFLGEFFLLKSVKKMCTCVGVKNCIFTCEKCMFWCEKGYKWISSPKIYCSYWERKRVNGKSALDI